MLARGASTFARNRKQTIQNNKSHYNYIYIATVQPCTDIPIMNHSRSPDPFRTAQDRTPRHCNRDESKLPYRILCVFLSPPPLFTMHLLQRLPTRQFSPVLTFCACTSQRDDSNLVVVSGVGVSLEVHPMTRDNDGKRSRSALPCIDSTGCIGGERDSTYL